ncbi:hypothetical protein [Faecalicatena contorta]|nr:hypothetical protein [Faecalicatena contorta]
MGPYLRLHINQLNSNYTDLLSNVSNCIDAINELAYEQLGNLYFEHNLKSSVTAEYSADNVLTFGGVQMYPEKFVRSTFLTILNGSASTGKGTIYLVVFGAADEAPAIVNIGGDETGLYPKLAKTASNCIYVAWSATATAGVHASLFKLY